MVFLKGPKISGYAPSWALLQPVLLVTFYGWVLETSGANFLSLAQMVPTPLHYPKELPILKKQSCKERK